jgi:hypothetical protein
MRDRDAGTVTFTSSLGFGRKLERIAADPHIAVAYHTRQHGHTDRRGLVVVQGIATVRGASDRERDEVAAQAAEHMGQVVTGRFWDRWLSVYYYDRVLVDVAVVRMLWWPDGTLDDEPVVIGSAPPVEPPAPQTPPREATTPRVALRRMRRSLSHPHLLLGYVQADAMPVIVPVDVDGTDEDGLVLGGAVPLTLPAGGRRAGVPRARLPSEADRPVDGDAHRVARGRRRGALDAAHAAQLRRTAEQDAAAARQRRGRTVGIPPGAAQRSRRDRQARRVDLTLRALRRAEGRGMREWTASRLAWAAFATSAVLVASALALNLTRYPGDRRHDR